MEHLKSEIKSHLCRADGYINMTLINAIEKGSLLHEELVNEIHKQFPFDIPLREKIYQKIMNMKVLFFRTGMKYSFTRNIFEINKYIN